MSRKLSPARNQYTPNSYGRSILTSQNLNKTDGLIRITNSKEEQTTNTKLPVSKQALKDDLLCMCTSDQCGSRRDDNYRMNGTHFITFYRIVKNIF